MPAALRAGINRLMNPTIYTRGLAGACWALLFCFRRFFVQPWVAWTMLNLALLLMGMSMTDPNFAAIVTKPDNVPIVGADFPARASSPGSAPIRPCRTTTG